MTLALMDHIAHEIAALAQRAVLYEVTTTPKPGLVDRQDAGAHRDMNFYTFMSSSTALYRGFYNCALAGLTFDHSEATLLLDKIRIPGIAAETDMFRATDGVNTHKGIIFSLGILAAATGVHYRRKGTISIPAESICDIAAQMTKDLLQKDFGNLSGKRDLTYGEALYVTKGITGIRGEVSGGFQTVLKAAVPVFRAFHQGQWPLEPSGDQRHCEGHENRDAQKRHNRSAKGDCHRNNLFLEVLLRLMADNSDTNLLARAGASGLETVQQLASHFVATGGMTQPSAEQQLADMNDTFKKLHLSPGGSADLLAVGIYLALLEGLLT